MRYFLNLLSFVFWTAIVVACGLKYHISTTMTGSWIKDFGVASVTHISEMRKDDKTIVLIGMVHTAQKEFYENVRGYMDGRTFIAMDEGITDQTKIMRIPSTYQDPDALMGILGHIGQDKAMGRWVNRVNADMDISAFSEDCIVFIRRYLKDVQSEILPKTRKNCDSEIIDKRNFYVVHKAKHHLSKWDTILIPWGAAHMSGIKLLLEKEGFKEEKNTTLFVDSLFYQIKNLAIYMASLFGPT